jgi:hypothetical protein
MWRNGRKQKAGNYAKELNPFYGMRKLNLASKWMQN